MDPYDSDSDLDDASYIATNVTIGYASKQPTGDDVSLLGGHPTWIDNKTAPSGALAKCKVCNDLLSLLVQVNGAVPERFPDHERRLYLFSCRKKQCRRKDGSVRGIRGTRHPKASVAGNLSTQTQPEEQSEAAVDIGSHLFGAKSPSRSTPVQNPFAVRSTVTPSPSSRQNPFSLSAAGNAFAGPTELAAKPPQRTDITILPETFAQKARISSPSPPAAQPPRPHEPWPPETAFPKPYPRYYLEAEYEELSKPDNPPIPPPAARLDADADAGAAEKEDKQLFESSMDTAFQRFADRLAQNPEQVLRYEFGGQPLLYAGDDAVAKRFHGHAAAAAAAPSKMGAAPVLGSGIPPCVSCGAQRVFELQLTPHAIAVLEDEDEGPGLDGMDWGTIILGVCSVDCRPRDTAEGEVGYVEEWVGVQWEELGGSKK